MYAMNMKFKKEKKDNINCVLHSPPPSTTSPRSLFCMHEALFCMHEPTHNYHVVVFLGSNPGFCQPDWASIVGLHDPILFADIDLLGSCGSVGVGVRGVVVVVVFSETDEYFLFR